MLNTMARKGIGWTNGVGREINPVSGSAAFNVCDIN